MIYRGEDKALSITIADASNVLQSIDNMVDLIVYIYSAKDHHVMEKYTKVLTAGYIQLLRVSATEYTAILPHSITEITPVKDLLIEIEIQEIDNRFPSNIRRTKGKGNIAEVKQSIITE
jgi:hypothetical protein